MWPVVDLPENTLARPFIVSMKPPLEADSTSSRVKPVSHPVGHRLKLNHEEVDRVGGVT